MTFDINTPTEFNVDLYQLILIFQIKDDVVNLFGEFSKNHELVYWRMRDFWREIDAVGDDKEREEMEKRLKETTEARMTYNNKKVIDNLNDYFNKIESFYIYLCRLLQKHGIYYRKGNDPRRAALRT